MRRVNKALVTSLRDLNGDKFGFCDCLRQPELRVTLLAHSFREVSVNFLLIMQGQSYLRDALTSFLRTEISEMDILTLERAEQISEISESSLKNIVLVLIHVGREPANSPSVVSVVEMVHARLKDIPIVMLGDLADDPQFRQALSVGTNGYIPTGTPADIFKHVLPIIARGGVYAPPFVFAASSDRQDAPIPNDDSATPRHEATGDPAPECMTSVEAFTRREVEVLSLLAEGLPNKIIAYRLKLKEGTVKVHIRHIMNKLNVTSRTQAALFAQKNLPGLMN